MEIPDRVKQHLDGESVQSAVNLGDEDLVCFTPTRTLLYRGEGLLSDESLQEFSHDVERLKLSEGRRKTTFTLEYVDTAESFTVSNKRTQQVLKRLLTGVLDAADVLDDDESVAGVFLFSELTVVITDQRLVKHVGTYVWDPDYEEYPYSEVTNLDFEEGSVATQIVLSVGGRPQRIKAPSDKAKKLRRALTESLFAYYEVDSLGELNELIRPEAEETGDADSGEGGLGLDNNISPLVEDDDADEGAGQASTSESDEEDTEVLSVGPRAGDESTEESDPPTDEAGTTSTEDGGTASTVEDGQAAGASGAQGVDPAEIEAMREEIATLQDAVDRQNEEIEKQRETIEQLIEELRKIA